MCTRTLRSLTSDVYWMQLRCVLATLRFKCPLEALQDCSSKFNTHAHLQLICDQRGNGYFVVVLFLLCISIFSIVYINYKWYIWIRPHVSTAEGLLCSSPTTIRELSSADRHSTALFLTHKAAFTLLLQPLGCVWDRDKRGMVYWSNDSQPWTSQKLSLVIEGRAGVTWIW